MAATGYTPIQLYYSTTAAAVPTAGNLASGELAINITDGKLYYKSNAGVVTLLAGATAGPAGGSNTQVQFNSSGALAGSANLTFNGTTLVANDITDSSLTSGRVTYATTAGNLTDSANLLYSGTDLTVYGLTVGRGAGAVSTNTAVGASALASGSLSGGTNTGIGYFALTANTTGANNTAVANGAMEANTTGIENSAFGSRALRFNTTGNYNSAFGRDALFNNTTASNNTAVGHQAGYTNTTGEVTAVGKNALYGNTTAIYGTAVGNSALVTNTTGEANSAFGRNALLSNSTGANNVGVGAFALQANTTASNNTAIGYQAGYSNTTSAANTYIGYQVGLNATGNTNVGIGSNVPGFYNSTFYSTTGSANTAVGASAGGGITSGSTNIAIGNTAMANGPVTGDTNIAIGWGAGINMTSGSSNTFVGSGRAGFQNGAGSAMTTGSKNSIFGTFSGNQGGLDIRTSDNYIVLSDGDGNPRGYCDNTGSWQFDFQSRPTGYYTGSTANFNNNTTTRWPISTSGKDRGWLGRISDNSGIVAYFETNSATTIVNAGLITITGSATTYGTSSDYRMKNVIGAVTGHGERIDALEPVEYKWKHDGIIARGFLAHKFQEVYASSVSGSKDAVDSEGNPVYQSMQAGSSEVIADLVAEIKSLRKRLADAGI